jgi:sterol desaturase/sphingolipid hydroxylase (fatty acid hydroxylase superfamily)
MTDRYLPYVWYPVLAGAAVAAFAHLLGSGVPLVTAAYAPVVAIALLVVVLEWRFPERLEWRPRWTDIRADAAFMAVVQVALPRLLAAGAAIAIAAWMHEHARSAWWPHAWPLVAQALAMVVAIDFVRYWLHRACHSWPALWRLHEVHHSPDILYVLNVGRFHPFEKALHFALDTAPFLVLGVAPELIACYFLLYSVNGLFQHSNVRLRYGWLNYFVGSAETHRWHHARDPKVAQCNFGNTTIVWDLVFGTWHLPENRRLDEIGITDRNYPKGFWDQMRAPFRRNAARTTKTLRSYIATLFLRARLCVAALVESLRIARMTRDPMKVQRALLSRIVHANRRTTFGERHGFREIASIGDYAQRVPVHEYEALRPYIDAEIERGERALTAEPPVCYARTSGTTGRPKDVPLNAAHLAALRRIQATSVAFQYRTCPQAFAGSILAIVSPAVEGVLANGRPYGSASGMVAGNTPALVREKFVLPAAVLTIGDSRLKYLTILRLALARSDVTYLGSANATTLLTLAKLYRQHERELLDDLTRGTFFLADALPQDVMHVIRPRLEAHPLRAIGLARLRAAHGELRLKHLWPELKLVVTWTCASAGIAVDALRRELGPATRILELGYVSSEFRGTVTIGRRSGSGLPTFDTHFFEFAEREAWDRGERMLLTLDRIRKGVDYYVVLTTPSGLYRYFINDVVRVTGFFNRTPLIKFSQKGKGVTNITGEKLYEAQVLAAVRSFMEDASGAARFVMMIADERACCYRLYVEPGRGAAPAARALAETVDEKLGELNIEYRAKRESGRLGALHAAWLTPDSGEAYKQFCVAAGQREGQFKTVAIAYLKDFRFDLEARVAERSA